ncbi:MAG: hypothetical protein NZ571_08795 [Anaerolineae bacterium]|nr:hypothetical protein [Anaerolineae bacterium]
MVWQPITDLPEDWQALAEPDLASPARLWEQQRKTLQGTRAYQTSVSRLRRRFAIETGIIERLYTIDCGIAQLLIERGRDTEGSVVDLQTLSESPFRFTPYDQNICRQSASRSGLIAP